jgi:hypothetical protein
MRAMHDPAEDVAAELVDAERMRPAHAGKRQARAHLRIAIGRPERSGRGDDEMNREDDRTDAEAVRRARPARAQPEAARGHLVCHA